MTIVKSLNGENFTIYLPRTEQDRLNNTYPQVQVDARGLTTYTLAALEREAKRTHKRIDREQRRALREAA